MLHEISNRFFWFTQPSSILTSADRYLAIIFLALLVFGIVFRILLARTKSEANRKVFNKFWHLGLTIGLLGLFWYFFRYENAPILSIRIIPGAFLIWGLFWMIFILKFLVVDYGVLKHEHEREALKNKYLPKSR